MVEVDRAYLVGIIATIDAQVVSILANPITILE